MYNSSGSGTSQEQKKTTKLNIVRPSTQVTQTQTALAASPTSSHPLVTAGTSSANTVGEWLSHFRAHAKHFTERDFGIAEIALQKIAQTECKPLGETKLQQLVMGAIVAERRPTIDGRAVRIGIPYRGDGNGRAIVKDVKRVSRGTLCEVVVLVPRSECDQMSLYCNLEKKQFLLEQQCVLQEVRPGVTLRELRLNGIYISGGPHDNPAVDQLTRPPKQRQTEADMRNLFEHYVIHCSLKENLPVLGVCGGSWRLAAEIGGEIEYLGDKLAKAHSKDMRKPLVSAHTVDIQPLSMLHKILETDNYRTFERNSTGNASQTAQNTVSLSVNSVHWAQSRFPLLSPLEPHPPVAVTATATGEDVTEAYEVGTNTAHFVMGIQWHPEYAMDGLIQHDTPVEARQHLHVLRALGDAAIDGKAATIIQSLFRTHKQRQEYQASLPLPTTDTTIDVSNGN